ncbi:SPFH domain-containing protein [Gardnerella swidsinskii]|uniref:SPFH domain-containing protein n=1 Tax=Gardnerella swidsinskii TaxID=2792979 RepID=UPI0036F4788C
MVGLLHIFDVVKYEGPESDDLIAWLHPNKELKPGTRLIVQESQIAVFVRGGRVAATYGPGTHKVDGNNPVFLTSLTKLVTGGVSPYSAKIWFINNVETLYCKWGLPSPVQVKVPGFGSKYSAMETLPVVARGTYKVHFGFDDLQSESTSKNIENFIRSCAGTKNVITKDVITELFSSKVTPDITSSIATFIASCNGDLTQLDNLSRPLTDSIGEKIAHAFDEYGMSIEDFVIKANLDEYSPKVKEFREKFVMPTEQAGRDADITKLNADAQQYKSFTETQAAAYDQKMREYTYQQKQAFEALKDAASNTGSGSNVMNNSMGMSMGMIMGGNIGSMMSKSMREINSINMMSAESAESAGTQNDSAGTQNDSAGTQNDSAYNSAESSQLDPFETLAKLKKMLDAGLITEEIFNEKRNEIISRM